jgi:hypothetical protein
MRCFISTAFQVSFGMFPQKSLRKCKGTEIKQENQLLVYVNNVNVLSEKKFHKTWNVN